MSTDVEPIPSANPEVSIAQEDHPNIQETKEEHRDAQEVQEVPEPEPEPMLDDQETPRPAPATIIATPAVDLPPPASPPRRTTVSSATTPVLKNKTHARTLSLSAAITLSSAATSLQSLLLATLPSPSSAPIKENVVQFRAAVDDFQLWVGGTGVALATIEDTSSNVIASNEDLDAVRELEVSIARFTPQVDLLISLGGKIRDSMENGSTAVEGELVTAEEVTQSCQETQGAWDDLVARVRKARERIESRADFHSSVDKLTRELESDVTRALAGSAGGVPGPQQLQAFHDRLAQLEKRVEDDTSAMDGRWLELIRVRWRGIKGSLSGAKKVNTRRQDTFQAVANQLASLLDTLNRVAEQTLAATSDRGSAVAVLGDDPARQAYADLEAKRKHYTPAVEKLLSLLQTNIMRAPALEEGKYEEDDENDIMLRYVAVQQRWELVQELMNEADTAMKDVLKREQALRNANGVPNIVSRRGSDFSEMMDLQTPNAEEFPDLDKFPEVRLIVPSPSLVPSPRDAPQHGAGRVLLSPDSATSPPGGMAGMRSASPLPGEYASNHPAPRPVSPGMRMMQSQGRPMSMYGHPAELAPRPKSPFGRPVSPGFAQGSRMSMLPQPTPRDAFASDLYVSGVAEDEYSFDDRAQRPHGHHPQHHPSAYHHAGYDQMDAYGQQQQQQYHDNMAHREEFDEFGEPSYRPAPVARRPITPANGNRRPMSTMGQRPVSPNPQASQRSTPPARSTPSYAMSTTSSASRTTGASGSRATSGNTESRIAARNATKAEPKLATPASRRGAPATRGSASTRGSTPAKRGGAASRGAAPTPAAKPAPAKPAAKSSFLDRLMAPTKSSAARRKKAEEEEAAPRAKAGTPARGTVAKRGAAPTRGGATAGGRKTPTASATPARRPPSRGANAHPVPRQPPPQQQEYYEEEYYEDDYYYDEYGEIHYYQDEQYEYDPEEEYYQDEMLAVTGGMQDDPHYMYYEQEQYQNAPMSRLPRVGSSAAGRMSSGGLRAGGGGGRPMSSLAVGGRPLPQRSVSSMSPYPPQQAYGRPGSSMAGAVRSVSRQDYGYDDPPRPPSRGHGLQHPPSSAGSAGLRRAVSGGNLRANAQQQHYHQMSYGGGQPLPSIPNHFRQRSGSVSSGGSAQMPQQQFPSAGNHYPGPAHQGYNGGYHAITGSIGSMHSSEQEYYMQQQQEQARMQQQAYYGNAYHGAHSDTRSATLHGDSASEADPVHHMKYIPDPTDTLDVRVSEVVNASPLELEVRRVGRGRYAFGGKVWFLKVLNEGSSKGPETVSVRVGGGWKELDRVLLEAAIESK